MAILLHVTVVLTTTTDAATVICFVLVDDDDNDVYTRLTHMTCSLSDGPHWRGSNDPVI